WFLQSATIAPLAQLDRASGYEPEGREFESLRARQFCFISRKSSARPLVHCQLADWNFNYGIGSWHGVVDGGNDLRHLWLDQDPPVPAENHDRELAAFQILLVRKVGVCGEQ